jgi:hypothetical protein
MNTKLFVVIRKLVIKYSNKKEKRGMQNAKRRVLLVTHCLQITQESLGCLACFYYSENRIIN